MSQTHSLTSAISAMSPLFGNRFGRSFRFCDLEFDEEAISDGTFPRFQGRFEF